MTRRHFLGVAAAGLSTGLLAACGQRTQPPGRGGAPARLTIGYLANITHAPALMAFASGAFADALPGVSLAEKTFNAGPSLIEALFAGAIDAGYVGPSPAINGWIRSKGRALKLIAGAMSGGASLVVRRDSGIASRADLAGRRLASPQFGNTQDVALRWYLREHGIQAEVLPTQNADTVNLFKQGQLAGAWVPEPWASVLALRAGGRPLLDERTLWPDGRFSSVCLVAAATLPAQQPEAVAGVLKAHLQALQLIAADPRQARQTCAQRLARITAQTLPAEVLERAFAAQEATYDPLAASVQAMADRAAALGMLGGAKPDLSALFELAPLAATLADAGLPPLA